MKFGVIHVLRHWTPSLGAFSGATCPAHLNAVSLDVVVAADRDSRQRHPVFLGWHGWLDAVIVDTDWLALHRMRRCVNACGANFFAALFLTVLSHDLTRFLVSCTRQAAP